MALFSEAEMSRNCAAPSGVHQEQGRNGDKKEKKRASDTDKKTGKEGYHEGEAKRGGGRVREREGV